MSTAAALAVTTQKAGTYVRDYDAIVEAMNRYTEGVRAGNSAAMKPSFHELCTFYGFAPASYAAGQLLAGPAQVLFDWVDGNGPSPNLDVRFASVDILDTIASVRLEMTNVTGKLAGETGATLSDLFQLIRIDGRWLISQKSFHWHAA